MRPAPQKSWTRTGRAACTARFRSWSGITRVDCCYSVGKSGNITPAGSGPTRAGASEAGEISERAASRRLNEEMSVVCPLTPIGTFTYRAELDAGLIEHEFVHVFRGVYDGVIAPNPIECDGYTWLEPDVIRAQIAAEPQNFSAWFRKYVDAGWPIDPPA